MLAHAIVLYALLIHIKWQVGPGLAVALSAAMISSCDSGQASFGLVGRATHRMTAWVPVPGAVYSTQGGPRQAAQTMLTPEQPSATQSAN